MRRSQVAVQRNGEAAAQTPATDHRNGGFADAAQRCAKAGSYLGIGRDLFGRCTIAFVFGDVATGDEGFAAGAFQNDHAHRGISGEIVDDSRCRLCHFRRDGV